VKVRRALFAVVAVVAWLVATGCGAGVTSVPRSSPESQRPRAVEDARQGYKLVLPAGWHRARRNLTPTLVDPREVLSVASYRLRFKRRARCYVGGCPTPMLNGFRATDILLSIQERAHAKAATENVGIDLRPRQTPRGAGFNRCARRRVAWYAFNAFAQAGRRFYVFAVVGKRATAETQRELRLLLHSLHFRPRHPIARMTEAAE
jgi:hypothetical protein